MMNDSMAVLCCVVLLQTLKSTQAMADAMMGATKVRACMWGVHLCTCIPVLGRRLQWLTTCYAAAHEHVCMHVCKRRIAAVRAVIMRCHMSVCCQEMLCVK